MEEVKQSVLGNLGIDWKLFVAQLANFGIVLFVLTKWVFKPLMKAVEERRGLIEQGLKDAQDSSAAKAKAQSEYEASVISTRREAARIIEEASASAEKLKGAMLAETKAEIAKVVEEGRARLAGEKERTVREAKKEVAGLVIASTEKVLSEVMDDKARRSLVESAARKLAA